jgi:ligand-binding sensor domain-containing protein
VDGNDNRLATHHAGPTANPFLHPKLLSQINISFLRESRTGQLWIGSDGQGLLRYQNGKITRFSAPGLLPHNNVLALFEDGEENVWVGTQGGLLRLSPSLASTVATADGTPQSINTIYQDPRGDLLVRPTGSCFGNYSGARSATLPPQLSGPCP